MKMKKIVFGLLGSLVLGKFYIIGGMSYFKHYEKVFVLIYKDFTVRQDSFNNWRYRWNWMGNS